MGIYEFTKMFLQVSSIEMIVAHMSTSILFFLNKSMAL